ncbi:hypothetical protein B0H10DRAFT_1944186 [Mycena sp. CBHHK59/15]|nr:hypothetical protein B0H10DRAFT_1944186 [Mycena sp. CBHHK59/15]
MFVLHNLAHMQPFILTVVEAAAHVQESGDCGHCPGFVYSVAVSAVWREVWGAFGTALGIGSFKFQFVFQERVLLYVRSHYMCISFSSGQPVIQTPSFIIEGMIDGNIMHPSKRWSAIAVTEVVIRWP